MRLVYTVQDLLPGDCWLGVQAVYKVLAPTSRELSAGSEACYMVSKPSSRELSTGVQLIYTVSKPTSRGLSAEVQLVQFQTYLQGTVGQRCSLFLLFLNLPSGGTACLYGFGNYLKGPVHLWYSLFIQFPNLLTRDCRTKVQPSNTVSEPTSWDCKNT